MITLAYKELIGRFEIIRDYIREFFVYGFKSRGDVGSSGRTYDNKRRQLESWLGDYMSFKQSASGKAKFISVDSREIAHNPLYNAFKTSTFSADDILLHFCILDMLTEEKEMSVREITDNIQKNYFDLTESGISIDEKTVRTKLKNYTQLGILSQTIQARKKQCYSLSKNTLNLHAWHNAIEFYSEMNPIGVIGSFLLDRKEFDNEKSCFWYKHHYMLYAMDSEIMELLLEGIEKEKCIVITTIGKKNSVNKLEVYPMKIYVSTQNGREYLLCHRTDGTGLTFIRLDNIRKVKIGEICEKSKEYNTEYLLSKQYLWGVTSGNVKDIVHIEMTIRVQEDEEFIVRRLEREKRNGQVFKINESQYKYVVDTYDAMELMPWIRTFMGRIEKLECNNPDLENKFYQDMESLYSMYFGGEDGDI